MMNFAKILSKNQANEGEKQQRSIQAHFMNSSS